MAKRIPKETICSFCIKAILDKDAYSVKLKMHDFLDTLEGNVYHTPCCKDCLDSDRIIGVFRTPKADKPKIKTKSKKNTK